ncbi:hypothetical protein ACFL58_03850 [Elusimicrobiota bacterium]
MLKNGALSTIADRNFSRARKMRFLACLVVFCIAFNALVPRFSIGASQVDFLSKVVQCESAVLDFFTLYSLPMKIIDKLFPDKNTLTASKNQNNTEKSRNGTNASSDFSIFGVDNVNNWKYSSQRTVGTEWELEKMTAGILVVASSNPMLPKIWQIYMALLLLMCFFMLPRSSIDDAYITYLKNNKLVTQLRTLSWVFHLYRRNLK